MDENRWVCRKSDGEWVLRLEPSIRYIIVLDREYSDSGCFRAIPACQGLKSPYLGLKSPWKGAGPPNKAWFAEPFSEIGLITGSFSFIRDSLNDFAWVTLAEALARREVSVLSIED